MKSNNILITGGAGFIGSNIAKKLVDQGHHVRIIDNLSTGHLKNLKKIKNKVDFVKGDITDLDLLMEKFKDMDYVLHQAALPSVPRSIANPLLYNNNNLGGTLNVLLAAKENKIKKLVYAASSSAYGNRKGKDKKETMKAQPLSPYAGAKLMGEYYNKIFYHVYGLETVCLRYFNVFGPNQDPNSPYSAVVPLFIKAALNDQSPTIYGDGKTSRDFTFVDNNVEANILAMTSDKAREGETINIACGKSYTLLELLETINKLLGKNIKPTFAPSRKGDVKHSLADISKAKKLIGYEPIVNFEEGLKKTIEYYKKEFNND